MKKTALFILFLCSFASHAQQLVIFQDVAKAISKGKKITFVINSTECSSQSPMAHLIASVTPNAVMVIGSNRITAAIKHFTLDNPAAPSTPAIDFSKYNINADGAVSIKIAVMNAANYELLASHQINCELNKGFKVFD